MVRRLSFLLGLLSLAAGGRAQTAGTGGAAREAREAPGSTTTTGPGTAAAGVAGEVGVTPAPGLTEAAATAGGAGAAGEARTLFAPVPLVEGVPVAKGALIVSQESARRALALGFATAAAAQAEQLVSAAEAGSGARDEAVLLLTTARLELGDTVGALRALGNHSEARSPAYRLRAGLIAAIEGRFPAAQAELAELTPESLAEEERAWFYFLQGLVAEGVKDANRAGAAYDQALGAATSDWQRARLRLTRERLRLGQGEVTESQANVLREQAERYAGRGVGTDYAVQYAVALVLLGRKGAATAYLEGQLASLNEPGLAGARDDTRLILGLIAGPAQGAGRAALELLLAGGADATKQRMALHLLAEATDTAEARNRLRRTLDELLMRVPAHPLQEDMFLARAELSLADQAYGQAEADAKELLARFPASAQRARALTQLAASAWEQKRFRTAADYATQAAGATNEAGARAALRLLAAEASYRAGDYATAADVYAIVAEAPPPGVAAAVVMFQQVMARIEAGQPGQAAELIDRLAGDARFEATTRWQAEWNLARALQAAGQGELALARVSRVRGEADAEARPPGLRARLSWLEARLAREAGRAEDALRLARAVPSSLAGVEAPLAREVAGLTRLVAAEALFNLDRGDEAVAELKKLREDMAGSEAAMQSFLIEADIRATTGGLVEAQGLLTKFADDYRDNAYAPYALFQAALNAERRGEEAFYREAYVLLQRIVDEYGQSEQVFRARLKQGDLLRRMNQFPVAQQIYELLVNQYSRHPDILAAQMALADSHRAQAAQDASHFESALTILERLRDLADAPLGVRAEAGFKLGDMLATRLDVAAESAARDAVAAWWPLVETLVLDRGRAAGLGVQGRYWMGRLLVRLAGIHEAQGRADEARDIWKVLETSGLPGARLARTRLGAGSGGGAVSGVGGAGGGAAGGATGKGAAGGVLAR